ncbi:MAG: tRNA pseudouridine(38-40) synthase TruA [Phycisphaeraceae bacterium]|nr:tRNA pseudouridine(38-40) synthase TruA [Phycisphaeraceae bacterium]
MTDTPPQSDAPDLSLPRRRYKLVLAYDGSNFRGWQKQPPPGSAPGSAPAPGSDAGDPADSAPGSAGGYVQSPPSAPRTVAGVMEDAIARTVGQPIKLVGASRTDAGVHALGQVAHFDAATRIPTERLAQAINARLPNDIEVLSAAVVPDTFDAITDAVSKQYRYRIFNAPQKPLAVRHLVYHCWRPLDLDAMSDAARRLIGTHDFAGFAAADHGRVTTVRTIFDCHVELHPLAHVAASAFFPPSSDPTSVAFDLASTPASPEGHRFPPRELHVVVTGSGFLYNMVRIIAGTLVEVGWGRLMPEVVTEVLATQNRRLAGSTLPPNGLCLEWIKHKE